MEIIVDAYLLTWNPNTFEWNNFHGDLKEFQNNGYLEGRWSTGNTKRIKKGDRLFMLRQGEEPRGIIASGYATSDGFSDKHWGKPKSMSNYVKYRLDVLVDYKDENQILSRTTLMENLSDVHWDTPASGMSVPSEALARLETLWSAINAPPRETTPLTEELDGNTKYHEGAMRTVQVNAYERDRKARDACIKHWGARCSVCDFSFEEKYGSLGHQFIHVHHIVPLSSIKKRYKVDPIKDLCPVCPNCHSMIHKDQSRPLSVSELRSIIGVPATRRSPRKL